MLAVGDSVWITGLDGIHRSVDGGKTFKRVFTSPGGKPWCMRLAARGTRIAAACSEWQRAIAWSQDGGETFWVVPTPLVANLIGVAFTGDSSLVAVGAWEEIVHSNGGSAVLVDHSPQTAQWLEIARARHAQETRGAAPSTPFLNPPPRADDPGPFAKLVRGVVRDERGRPVSGQKLSIVFAWAHHGEGYQESSTDAEGRFQFAPSRGTVRLEVTRPRFERVSRSIAVDELRGNELELVLRAAVQVSGRVAGASITGGSLRALPLPPAGVDLADWLYRTAPVDYTELGADGTFRFNALGAGEFLLDVQPIGALAFTARVRAPDAEVLLTAGQGGRITGVVKDAAGKPVAGAQLWAREAKARGSGFTALVTADAQGRFEIAGAPDGELELDASPAPPNGTVSLGGNNCRGTNVTITGASHATVELTLGGGGVIRGAVVDEAGRPVSGATVIASTGRILCDGRAAVSGADGSFELTNVNPGAHRVTATMGKQAAFRMSDDVTASAGDSRVRLVLHPPQR